MSIVSKYSVLVSILRYWQPYFLVNNFLSFINHHLQIFSPLLEEFTPGETLLRKPSSSVPWACSATWRTQRLWSRLILSMWNQKVRAPTVRLRSTSSVSMSVTLFADHWNWTLCILLPFSKGDDMESLLFHFLDDWLYKFSADLFFIPRVSMLVSGQFWSAGHYFHDG